MRSQSYDILAQFSDDWRGAFLARILHVKLTVARQPKLRSAVWLKSFNHIARRGSTPRSAAEQDVDLLRTVGLYEKPFAPAYQLVVPESLSLHVSHWLESHGMALGQKQLLVLHAAARWKFKGLPKTTWGELIDQLQSAGHYVVLKRIRPATIA